MMRLFLFVFVLSLGCLHAAEPPPIIPRPLTVEPREGSFLLNEATSLTYPAEWKAQAELLTAQIKREIGIQIKPSASGSIRFEKDDSINWREAYQVEVSPNHILLKASTSAGLFNACQSLLQLIPKNPPHQVPAIRISDAPRFPWRGLMLDSSRHFQSVAEVKRFIDLMSRYKLNVFHWHLTDGHGWRIEIRKYPKLTELGAWRQQPGYPEPGKTGRYGGFYTQDEIREVVKFAAERNITIVPEIDMPGHNAAAISAYPELGCSGKPQPVDWFFDYPCKAQKFPPFPGTNELCVGRDETVRFTTEVLSEVIDLFPSTYLHIGGDEVNAAHWKQCPRCQKRKADLKLADEHALQSWFIKELDRFLTSKNRRLLGWNEILDGGLAPGATVMSWTGEEGGIAAAKMGHDVIMTPQNFVYLDHGQSNSPLEPNHWPGHNPLEKAYRYDPIPAALDQTQAKHILGLQGNVWTVFVHEPWLLDLQTWPRACAISEVGWSSTGNRDWGNFLQRLRQHRPKLDALGVNYWWEDSAELGSWSPATITAEFRPLVLDVSKALASKPAGELPVTFSYLKGAHGLAIRSAKLLINGTPAGSDVHDGFTGWSSKANTYRLSHPAIPAGAKVELICEIRSDGGTDSQGRIVSESVETRKTKGSP